MSEMAYAHIVDADFNVIRDEVRTVYLIPRIQYIDGGVP